VFNKPLEKVTVEDIQALIEPRKERENQHLEYKSDINNSDDGKKEFLKDVTGLANAEGGYLILGIKEDDGLPQEICGISKEVGNQKIEEWITNVLISNLDPRLSFQIKVLDLENKTIVIIYIPESAKKPHMVTFKGKNIFYVRHNVSVDPATQSEVRDMFEYSKTNREKLQLFLKEKNLLNEKDDSFAENENTKKLYNLEFEEDPSGQKIPFVLYSFIPRFLDDYRVNTARSSFRQWLEENCKGYQPLPDANLFIYLDVWQNPQQDFYGVTYSSIADSDRDKGIEKWDYYFEFLRNGYFESAISHEGFRNVLCVEGHSKFLLATNVFGYGQLLMNFAKAYYSMIGYYDEVIFQISVVNIKGFFFDELFNRLQKGPSCKNDKLKVHSEFLVSDISTGMVEKTVYEMAKEMSWAWGLDGAPCYDRDGNFNINSFKRFRGGWRNAL
jgi:hypothetical protein